MSDVTPEDINMAACAARTFLVEGSAPNNKTLAAQLSRALLHLLDSRTDPRRQFLSPEIMTASGAYFDFENPDRFDWNIEDLAQGLSLQTRFTGQCKAFYSIAQHSCLAADQAIARGQPEHAFETLMHDATEALVGDMATPLKILCPDYRVVEDRCEAAMRARYDLPAKMSPEVKAIDLFMLAWERRDLLPDNGDEEQWQIIRGIEPPAQVLTPWSPEWSKIEFMDRFRRLLPDHLIRVDARRKEAARG